MTDRETLIQALAIGPIHWMLEIIEADLAKTQSHMTEAERAECIGMALHRVGSATLTAAGVAAAADAKPERVSLSGPQAAFCNSVMLAALPNLIAGGMQNYALTELEAKSALVAAITAWIAAEAGGILDASQH